MSSCKSERLSRFADSMRTVRGYVCGPDEDWREALSPEFWHNATGRLQVGDRIEVHSHDHATQFFVLIFGANDRGSIRCDVGFAPIWPLDLQLPGPSIREARYRSVYDGNGHNVVEIVSGEVLGVFGREPEAREAIAALEARDASTVTPLAPVTPAKPTVSPGAARTARYRARHRDKVAAA
jgi:hypothetical protein